MFIVDTHTHIFPDAAAERILQFTSQQFKVKVYGKGTASDLLSQMDESGVGHAVIHMVATTPQSVKDINSWLIHLKEPRFVKFGTVLPFQQDCREEIRRLKDSGIGGIKLQPEVQGFTVDDAAVVYPLYEELVNGAWRSCFTWAEIPSSPPTHDQPRAWFSVWRRTFPSSPSSARTWAVSICGTIRPVCWPGGKTSTWKPP